MAGADGSPHPPGTIAPPGGGSVVGVLTVVVGVVLTVGTVVLGGAVEGELPVVVLGTCVVLGVFVLGVGSVDDEEDGEGEAVDEDEEVPVG